VRQQTTVVGGVRSEVARIVHEPHVGEPIVAVLDVVDDRLPFARQHAAISVPQMHLPRVRSRFVVECVESHVDRLLIDVATQKATLVAHVDQPIAADR
jgi:hypothetical protein